MTAHLPRDENALLAFDGAYLAGLSRFGWTDGGEQLIVMTVARDVRYKGMGVGLLSFERALALFRNARDETGSGCGALARINHCNDSGEHMFKSAGFVYLGG
ncbi:hypothetical protein [Curtobacterium flaccumfaciens]|uniref:hypothetical protein n=1 Tax=Curtobacterium flaccumfaciens TaxID=2035 RepID=UPI001AD96162|nr:hypothetical protein [Curtobacterium flaccumfaciens]MBO9051358.1 hypothetical protein [Curtobacterium flaccumfaciens pv. flaccumfaciens]